MAFSTVLTTNSMRKSLVLLFFGLACLPSFAQVKFFVHLDSSATHPLTGRLIVSTTADTAKGFKNGVDNDQPRFALNIKNWTNDQVIEVDDKAEALSIKPSQMKPGYYKVIGFMDANVERGGFNPGNFYSTGEPVLQVQERGKGEIHIYLNREVKQRAFNESDSIKLMDMRSPLLSSFQKNNVFIKGAVILPAGYHLDTTKRYPVVFVIPGWGGTHYDALNKDRRGRYGMRTGIEKIFVYLNPETQTRWGLHAFVDSRVNGPWGKALVEEVIPYIRNNYRTTGSAAQTFVMGQSSGGYPSLWLPLHYPDAFGGGWAVSPDPVDFSDFVGINIYDKNANYFYQQNGELRGFFLKEGRYQSTVKREVGIEVFEDDGTQTQAFEAAFGRADATGRPYLLFNRQTGAINQEVVEDWKPYDMGLFLQHNWNRLSEKLSGKKLHVYAGANDNFHLDRSVAALKAKAAAVKADIVVEIIPDADHWSIWSKAFTDRIHKEMDALILAAAGSTTN
jgi:S-formylglutathione hydrolase FrmB